MLHKTRGIVFRFVKFRETSIIVTIFTELFGLQTYIVNGVRSSKATGKMALYQPLTLLDLVVYYKENANIKRIKEIKCLYAYNSVARDIRKSSLGLFLNEVMNKTVKEESHAHEMFDFIYQSMLILDQQEKGYENFHLIFLIKLSRLLGFGAHTMQELSHLHALQLNEESLLNLLLKADYDTFIPMTNDQRRAMLDVLLKFYATHIDSLGEIRSISVLKEVLG